MTALNNHELTLDNARNALQRELLKYNVDARLAVALAEQADAHDLLSLSAHVLAQQTLRLCPSEMFNRFLQYEGIIGFTRTISQAACNIRTLTGRHVWQEG